MVVNGHISLPQPLPSHTTLCFIKGDTGGKKKSTSTFIVLCNSQRTHTIPFNIDQCIRGTGWSCTFTFRETYLSRERGGIQWLEEVASLGYVVAVPPSVFRFQLFGYQHAASGNLSKYSMLHWSYPR